MKFQIIIKGWTRKKIVFGLIIDMQNESQSSSHWGLENNSKAGLQSTVQKDVHKEFFFLQHPYNFVHEIGFFFLFAAINIQESIKWWSRHSDAMKGIPLLNMIQSDVMCVWYTVVLPVTTVCSILSMHLSVRPVFVAEWMITSTACPRTIGNLRTTIKFLSWPTTNERATRCLKIFFL